MGKHDRILQVPHLHNFRDIGGYECEDGHHVVKYKHLFRADDLSLVTASGAEILRDTLRVRFTVDFRSEKEIKSHPYDLGPTVSQLAIPIEAYELVEQVKSMAYLSKEEVLLILRETAQTFLMDFHAQYRTFFKHLLHTVKGAPCVFHCTAGKDRTGMAAALLLTALGVPFHTVMEDFVLVNTVLGVQKYSEACVIGQCTISPEALQELQKVQPFFLSLAFEGVIAKFGSVQAYMHGMLELTEEDIETLRQYYTRKFTFASRSRRSSN